MLRPTNLFFLAILLAGSVRAQTSDNHYQVKFHEVRASSKADMESALYKLTGASQVSFNTSDSTFMLSTPRLLDKTVIAGKLQKHFFPVMSIRHLETDIDPFPMMRNSGNAEADALQYEQEKDAWIKKYPDAYRKMVENK